MNGLALCAGVGGLDLGLRLALGPRFRSVVYVEREAYAAAALVARMEDEALDPAPVWDDLVTFDGRPWRGVVDLVTAGFPCQPWSVAGQRKGTADERWLWPDILRIIREVDPSLVFLENVPGLLRHGLSIVLEDLASVGFDAEWDSFRASELGAPHKRERLFILAHAAVERQREPHDEASAYARARARAHPRGERRLLADAERARPQGLGPQEQKRRGKPLSLRGDRGALPPFPPGPGDEAGWARVLAVRPDLAPAVVNAAGSRRGQREEYERDYGGSPHESARPLGAGGAAPEPVLRGLADGMAPRVERLRAAGNGVVPIVAGYAFLTLAERLGVEVMAGWSDAVNVAFFFVNTEPQEDRK